MFESKDSTLGIYNRVDINQLGYCNGLRLIDLQAGLIKGYDDTYNMFMVKYDSIKPFNPWY